MTDEHSSTTGASPTKLSAPGNQVGWQAFSTLLAQAEPMAHSAVCAQMTTISFVGSRARTRLEFATQLTRCRSPQDFMAAQAEFWLQAGRDYMGFTANMASLWPQMFGLSAVRPEDTGPVDDVLRDFISLPETAPAATSPPSKAGTRHAA